MTTRKSNDYKIGVRNVKRCKKENKTFAPPSLFKKENKTFAPPSLFKKENKTFAPLFPKVDFTKSGKTI